MTGCGLAAAGSAGRNFRRNCRSILRLGVWYWLKLGSGSVINISRSPLRISFFGGGTDYPTYFNHHPGAVLGASIDKYIYTIALPMADFAENRFRITYRIVEVADRVEDIKHNVIRATLLNMGYDKPLNVAIISDLPGNSGLGSSSSFTVGFIALMEYLSGRSITKFDLFKRAVHTERDLLKENVGIQDQIHAAFGGPHQEPRRAVAGSLSAGSAGDFQEALAALLGRTRPTSPRRRSPAFRASGRTNIGDGKSAICRRAIRLRLGGRRLFAGALSRRPNACWCCWARRRSARSADRLSDGHAGGRLSWKELLVAL